MRLRFRAAASLATRPAFSNCAPHTSRQLFGQAANSVCGTIAEPKRHGFSIYIMGWSTNGWNKAKVALSFAKLENDGDDEGAFFLDRLPTKSEAEIIRKWTGVAKKAEYSAETLAAMSERLVHARQSLQRAA